MTDMDFSGFDDASLGALVTDLNVAGLEAATDGTALPDPVDAGGIDVDLVDDVDGLGDAADPGDGGAAIQASDGTTYGSYTDFVHGFGPGRG